MVCLSEKVIEPVPFTPVTSVVSVTAFSGAPVTFFCFSSCFPFPVPRPTHAEGKQVTSYAAGATMPGKHCITEAVLSSGRSREKIILLVSLSSVKLRCCLQR